jgi:hypothetical protein
MDDKNKIPSESDSQKEEIILKAVALSAVRERKKAIDTHEKKLSKELKDLIEARFPNQNKVAIQKRVGDNVVTVSKTFVDTWKLATDTPTFLRAKKYPKEILDKLIIKTEVVDKKLFEMYVKDGEIDAEFASTVIIEDGYSRLTTDIKKFTPEEDYEDGFD